MDDQNNQSMQQPAAPVGAPTDPMAQPAMQSTPPMPTPDIPGATVNNGPTDPMVAPAMPAAPAAGGMDMMAGMTPPPPPPPAPSAPLGSTDPMGSIGMATPAPMSPAPAAPAATGPATMDDIMAELRKIEDKLVEMDEKL